MSELSSKLRTLALALSGGLVLATAHRPGGRTTGGAKPERLTHRHTGRPSAPECE